jgi:hypothetical protein
MKRPVLTDVSGVPIGLAVAGANRHDRSCLAQRSAAFPPRGRGRGRGPPRPGRRGCVWITRTTSTGAGGASSTRARPRIGRAEQRLQASPQESQASLRGLGQRPNSKLGACRTLSNYSCERLTGFETSFKVPARRAAAVLGSTEPGRRDPKSRASRLACHTNACRLHPTVQPRPSFDASSSDGAPDIRHPASWRPTAHVRSPRGPRSRALHDSQSG